MRTSSTGVTDEDRITVRTLECKSLTSLTGRQSLQLISLASGQLTQEERPSGLIFIRHKSSSDLRCNKLTEPSEADADLGAAKRHSLVSGEAAARESLLHVSVHHFI